MSTEIHITVEGDGLPELARSYQQQNRQNDFERKAREKAQKLEAAETAKKEQQQRNQQASSQSTTPKYRPEEPAANRRLDLSPSYGWTWKQPGQLDYQNPQPGGLLWLMSGSLAMLETTYPYLNNGVFELHVVSGNGTSSARLFTYDNTFPASPGAGQRRFIPEASETVSSAGQYAITDYMMRSFRYKYRGAIDMPYVVLPTGKNSSIIIVRVLAYKWWIDMSAYTFRQTSFQPSLAAAESLANIWRGQETHSVAWTSINGIETTHEYSQSIREETYAAVVSTTGVRLIDSPAYFNQLFTISGQRLISRAENIRLNLDFIWASYQVPELYPAVGFPSAKDGLSWGSLGPDVYTFLNNILPFTSVARPSASSIEQLNPDYSKGAYQVQYPNGAIGGKAFSDKQMFEDQGTPAYFLTKRRLTGGNFVDQPISVKSLALASNRVQVSQVPYTSVTGPNYAGIVGSIDSAYCQQMLLALGFTEADFTP